GKKDENALDLWLEMYRAEVRGDDRARQRARDRMERYCIQDVRLLPKMYKDLLPWLTGINANLYTDDMDGCPNCPAGPEPQVRHVVQGGARRRVLCRPQRKVRHRGRGPTPIAGWGHPHLRRETSDSGKVVRQARQGLH